MSDELAQKPQLADYLQWIKRELQARSFPDFLKWVALHLMGGAATITDQQRDINTLTEIIWELDPYALYMRGRATKEEVLKRLGVMRPDYLSWDQSCQVNGKMWIQHGPNLEDTELFEFKSRPYFGTLDDAVHEIIEPLAEKMVGLPTLEDIGNLNLPGLTQDELLAICRDLWVRRCASAEHFETQRNTIFKAIWPQMDATQAYKRGKSNQERRKAGNNLFKDYINRVHSRLVERRAKNG